MKKDKREKWFWETTFNIKPGRLNNIDPVAEKLNFKDSEMDDEALSFITARIKVIGYLALDNTLVTDAGITYLTQLDEIKELRLKGCRAVTKAGIADLNKLKGIEQLHLYGTQIDLDAAFALDLPSLKHIMLSSTDGEEVITTKVALLQIQLPNCEINVNYTVY